MGGQWFPLLAAVVELDDDFREPSVGRGNSHALLDDARSQRERPDSCPEPSGTLHLCGSNTLLVIFTRLHPTYVTCSVRQGGLDWGRNSLDEHRACGCR